MEFSVAELFSLFSSFLAVLIAVIILFKMKGNIAIRINLVALLLICALIVLLGDLNFSGKIRQFPHLIRLDSPLHYLAPPFFYFYTLSSLKKDFRLKPIHLIHLLPFIVNVIDYMPFYLSDSTSKLDYYNGFMVGGTVIVPRQYLIKTIIFMSYLVAQVFLYFKYIYQGRQGEKLTKSLSSWFIVFLFIQLICYSSLVFDHLTGLRTFPDPYKFAMIMMGVLLISVSIAILFFPVLLYGNVSLEVLKSRKYVYSNLSEEEKERILAGWISYTEGIEKPYLNPKLSITEVARRLSTNQQRLSQVINEKTGMSFNDYINSLRIAEARKILTTDAYQKLTIDAIARESGFNSKSAFYASFKKITGMTPRQYLESRGG